MDSARIGRKGQSSLEALLAFAALLCALSVLAHAAKAQADALVSAIEVSNARTLLAREAFCIDLAADMLPSVALQRNLSGVPVSEGKWLSSKQSGALREPLFHKISIDLEGKYHVRGE